ncbi:hypothetical protein SAMN04488005_3159 [Yoonia tamlensis]|uniref:Lipoprotein n=1 Tax=Yoonia tamlensis TaxID=390270 RepID=A0A1I6HZV1_9RHOB|nr:hypothetical protein SAMN04488005_3159 [Yoonia tamlensis]
MLRQVACLVGVLAIAACTPVTTQDSMVFTDSNIIAQAPTGYCVDGAASNPETGFAVLALCATLQGGGAIPSTAAVATIQIGAANSGMVAGGETALRDFLESDAGAALLSGSGDSSTISVVDAQSSRGRVTVNFSDSAPHSMPGLQSHEWRAFKDINGRLVTVALRGLATAPLDESTGIWLLNAITTGISPVVFAQTDAQSSES